MKNQQVLLDKFYKHVNLGFDSNLVTINKITNNEVHYNFLAKNYIYNADINKIVEQDNIGEKMERTFKSKNGKVTDIMHSHNYYKATAKQRNDLAFNKQVLGELSERDKLLMRGYGQRIIEEQNAFKYKNPNYKRKTAGMAKPTSATALRKQFFN